MTKKKNHENLTAQKYMDDHRIDFPDCCYMQDMDSVAFNYDVNGKKKSVAYFELKHYAARGIEQGQVDALLDIAYGRPAFVVFYYYPGVDEFNPEAKPNRYGNVWQYKVFPVNPAAVKFIEAPTVMTKREYVRFQLQLRGSVIDESRLKKYDNTEKYVPFCCDDELII